jgi:hypothetical protein
LHAPTGRWRCRGPSRRRGSKSSGKAEHWRFSAIGISAGAEERALHSVLDKLPTIPTPSGSGPTSPLAPLTSRFSRGDARLSFGVASWGISRAIGLFIRTGDERGRLVAASPVMSKSRAPAGGGNYPENGLVKPPRHDTRALSPVGMFGGKMPLRLTAQKNALHAPSVPMRSAPAYFLCKLGCLN